MTDSAPRVEVFYSYRSPYSYLAIARLRDWAVEDGIDLLVRPVLPFAVRSPEFFHNLNPLGPAYTRRDAQRMADFLGLPFEWPSPDPVVMSFDPIEIPEDQPYIHRLTRLGVEAGRLGNCLDFTYEVSSLIWSGGDWTAGDKLKNAAVRAGLDLPAMDAAIETDPELYIRLIAENQSAHLAAGHWGVPTMVYEGEPFFGQDRIEVLKWRVRECR